MKNKKTKIFALILLVVSIIVGLVVYRLRSKTLQSETQVIVTLSVKAFENLFGDSSCAWPCWQGIIPGVTTRDEALQILNNSPIIVEISTRSNELAAGFDSINWKWVLDDSETTGLARSQNGIVYEIQLKTNQSISIGEIINRFGPPEKINIIDCTEVPEGEFRYWCGILYYTKKGFSFHSSWAGTWDEQDLKINPSDPIEIIALIKPSTIEEWALFNGLDISSFNLRDWEGYGGLYDLYVR